MFLGDGDGGADVVQCAVGNSGDFVGSKAFNGVQDENFAGSAAGPAKRNLHKTQHFIGRGDLLGRGDAAIGDHGFAEDRFVGLVKLEFGFVAGLDVALAGRIFQVHVAVVFIRARGHLVDRAHG
ncbi:MAG: hypothetical protein DMG83_05675 [Acidobacteria bacterium]|nr:MAG: hypothetical protein DMG83_05675 [Acidobacteriota bacterium]